MVTAKPRPFRLKHAPASAPKKKRRPPPKVLKLTRWEPSEAQIMRALKQVLDLLVAQRKLSWWARINTGAGWLLRPNGTKVWIEFGFEGCPDFIAQTTQGRFAGIEAKTLTGTTRAAQEAFLEKVAGHGGIAVVARDVNDVMEALK